MAIYAMLLAALFTILSSDRQPVVLHAQDAQLTGVTLVTSRPGYSGPGYLTNFSDDKNTADFKFKADGGFYEMFIRYASPAGEKRFSIVVDDVPMSGQFHQTKDAFTERLGGLVHLNPGDNTLEIKRGWGFFEIESIRFNPIDAPRPLMKPPQALSDPQATPATRAWMDFLLDNYGKSTLTGVYSADEAHYVQDTTKQLPSILAGDLMDCSPSRVERGANGDAVVDGLLEQAKNGYIISVSWHWNAPANLVDKMLIDKDGKELNALWYKGFNTTATTFDLTTAMANPDSQGHRLLLRDIDAIALQLKKLSDAGIPVLWRPMHEAGGTWFWWGAHGPDTFVQLWRLMHDRLTNFHQLHNLIWVYSADGDAKWYPGDDYVDVVGTDIYTDVRDPLSSQWEDLQTIYGGHKLIALTEFGGVPDIEQMQNLGVRWSYYISWTGAEGPHKLKPDQLNRIFNYPGAGTLGHPPRDH